MSLWDFERHHRYLECYPKFSDRHYRDSTVSLENLDRLQRDVTRLSRNFLTSLEMLRMSIEEHLIQPKVLRIVIEGFRMPLKGIKASLRTQNVTREIYMSLQECLKSLKVFRMAIEELKIVVSGTRNVTRRDLAHVIPKNFYYHLGYLECHYRNVRVSLDGLIMSPEYLECNQRDWRVSVRGLRMPIGMALTPSLRTFKCRKKYLELQREDF